MYHMSDSEFRKYEMAERRLQYLRKQHQIEIQQAYDGIHPTRTCFDYEQKEIYWESVNPCEYAIYLIELKEEHERIEKWWSLRAAVYRESFENLTDEERSQLTTFDSYEESQTVRNRLKQILIDIVSTRPELQRKPIQMDVFEDMEEADRRIENMSMEELFEDYWDLDTQENEDNLNQQVS
ncbi:hypothetical protein [Bacillus sp. Hm123]|uniref:hypothetical protein n=1 Tax=Bacillus sp. Hm123 TaxID=3450745 RepID=UPI003F4322E9